ncbi:MAG: response regulator transcription factor [Desulfobacterales bacterium]
MGKTRFVLVDDHAVVRQGIKALLSSNPDYEVVGEAEDAQGAVRCCRKHKPCVVFLDVRMPKMNGLEVIDDIRKQCPDTKVIMLSAYRSEEFLHAALKQGAHGYITKSATYPELEIAIANVLKGGRYLSADVTRNVVDSYLEAKKAPEFETKWGTLTKREREVLNLIAEGNKNKQIADYLCISVKTVEKHRSNLIGKLNLHSSAELTAYTLKNQIFLDELTDTPS